ncbi:MAG: glutamine-hydrolyzing carbamoyl-phosphate synthase small subunit, partial [Mucinivorans sp.]
MNTSPKATLLLEDGTRFEGYSFGAKAAISGEIVFNTSMTGYPESLTDPSYAGQILVLTFPLVGNYGVPSHEQMQWGLPKNFESEKIHVKALVVSDYSFNYSHWSAVESLSEWLTREGIPAIYNVDTRAITKIIRERGVMLAKLWTADKVEPKVFENPNTRNLVAEVSCQEISQYGEGELKIVMVDCGVKYNIMRCLLKRGATVVRVPWDYDFSGMDYDGVMISNGPGDPQLCGKTIENIKKGLAVGKPLFGICLGNQLLACAAGASTYKMKYGHRSHNQPARECGSNFACITSQNHGYAIDPTTLEADWEPYFTNLNDDTIEGIRHKSGPFFSVQFHPEATSGPVDSEFLFDKFLE